jgi:hypothetical protein
MQLSLSSPRTDLVIACYNYPAALAGIESAVDITRGLSSIEIMVRLCHCSGMKPQLSDLSDRPISLAVIGVCPMPSVRKLCTGLLLPCIILSCLAFSHGVTWGTVIAAIPADLGRAVTIIGGEHGFAGFLLKLLLIMFLLAAAFAVEKLLGGKTTGLISRPPAISTCASPGMARVCGGMLNRLPTVVGLTAFVATALFLVILTSDLLGLPGRSLFMALFTAVLLARCVTLTSGLLCAPDMQPLRLLPLGDALAEQVHRSIVVLSWYVASTLMLIVLLVDLSARPDPPGERGCCLAPYLSF